MTVHPELLGEYFDEAAAVFGHAVARAGAGVDHALQIAGHSAQLKFAGAALAPRVLPALTHLPADPAVAPQLTVRIWDSESTNTALPPPPWEHLQYHERGNLRTYDDSRFSLSFDRRTDVFSAVDNQRGAAVYWTRDADALPHYETAAPLKRVLQGWLRSRGLFVMHAAAIGRPSGGMLLAGRTGSGKSTTAVLSLVCDLMYAGDDVSLVQSEPVPYVHNLYSSAKINAETLDWIPEVRAAVSNADRLDREKAMLFVDSTFPHKLSSGFPLKAIVVPRVTGRPDTTFSRTSPLATYRAIAPDSVFTMLGDARGLSRTLNTLVNDLPCYDLALGADRQGVVDALEEVLSLS